MQVVQDPKRFLAQRSTAQRLVEKVTIDTEVLPLADVDDPRLAGIPPENAGVVGLAATGDVEGGLVEHHPMSSASTTVAPKARREASRRYSRSVAMPR